MTSATTSIPTFPLARAWGWLSLTALAAAILVGLPGLLLGLPDRPGLALTSLLICFAAAVAALEPVRRAARYGFQRVTLAALLTFPLRLALVAVGVVALVQLTDWPVAPLAMWTLLWYLVFLCVEVAVIVQYLAAATTGPVASLPSGVRTNPDPARVSAS